MHSIKIFILKSLSLLLYIVLPAAAAKCLVWGNDVLGMLNPGWIPGTIWLTFPISVLAAESELGKVLAGSTPRAVRFAIYLSPIVLLNMTWSYGFDVCCIVTWPKI